MKVRLETNRLLLREYHPNDLAAIHQYASQPLVVQYQNWGPNSLEQTQQFLHQVQANSLLTPRMSYELCIERKEDGQVVGGCELALSSEDHSMATLGYILNPLFWNQGYATEASQELMRFGFIQLKVTRIRATCDQQNVASRCVLEKSGFVLEASLPDDFVQKGQLRTTLVFTCQRLAQGLPV